MSNLCSESQTVSTLNEQHQLLIDPRFVPPTAAQVEIWLLWSAQPGDPDEGSLSDEHGD